MEIFSDFWISLSVLGDQIGEPTEPVLWAFEESEGWFRVGKRLLVWFLWPVRETMDVMPITHPAPKDQERLYPAIGAALLKSVPEDWKEILLRIKANHTRKIELEIFGPAGVSNLRVPDDSLFQSAIELYELFARDAKAFESCDFSLTWDDARETWRFNAKYAYPAEA